MIADNPAATAGRIKSEFVKVVHGARDGKKLCGGMERVGSAAHSIRMRYDATSTRKIAQMIPEVVSLPDFDASRLSVNSALEPDRKTALGQFMTPSVVADYMASLFSASDRPAVLLDAGAGIGSLTIAAAQKLGDLASVDVWEIDPIMREHLERNLDLLGVEHTVHGEDFILSAVQLIALARGKRYTHAILNPPYKKLNSDSIHRTLIRKVGIETVNLYTAFVALAVLLMERNGEVVAIIPRSFCNGPYYRPFRRMMFKTCSLDRIHVFESRTKAFKDDDVLQENVVIKLVRGKEQGDIVVSSSHDQRLTDYSERKLPFAEIVKPADPEVFIHVPTADNDTQGRPDLFEHSLNEIGLEVCTGPVVDFRLRAQWLVDPIENSIPLIYPHHFSDGKFQYPKQHKKPNALLNDPAVGPWLMPNECYVVVKRFSSKEERRRVVAYVYDPDEIKSRQVGFENHWNVLHFGKRGIDPLLAKGLACFLNSTILDKHFRVFSGHTQVNATDLRNMKYPRRETLLDLGAKYRADLTQDEIDAIIHHIHE